MNTRRHLTANSSVLSILPFMLSTVDGIFTLILILLYALWGASGLAYPLPSNAIAAPGHMLAVSVIVPVIYLKMRIDTYSDDRYEACLCILVMLFFAAVPFYRQLYVLG